DADADLQHLLAGVRVELGDRREVAVVPVVALVLELVEPRQAQRLVPRVPHLRRSRVPVARDLLLLDGVDFVPGRLLSNRNAIESGGGRGPSVPDRAAESVNRTRRSEFLTEPPALDTVARPGIMRRHGQLPRRQEGASLEAPRRRRQDRLARRLRR